MNRSTSSTEATLNFQIFLHLEQTRADQFAPQRREKTLNPSGTTGLTREGQAAKGQIQAREVLTKPDHKAAMAYLDESFPAKAERIRKQYAPVPKGEDQHGQDFATA